MLFLKLIHPDRFFRELSLYESSWEVNWIDESSNASHIKMISFEFFLSCTCSNCLQKVNWMPYLSIGMVHVYDVDKAEQIAWKTVCDWHPHAKTTSTGLNLIGIVTVN